MSHQPERKDKNCLNCGTEVAGRYCQRCGQENIIPHQSFLALTKHFIYDIFHFDGKFFDTLKYLLFQPGKVPKEYVHGKRTKYLDPIRMYLFTSAVFFIIFFSFVKVNDVFKDTGDRSMTKMERFETASRLYASQKDTIQQKQLTLLLDTTRSIYLREAKPNKFEDSTQLIEVNGGLYFMEGRVDTSNVQMVSKTKKTSWINRNLNQKWKMYKKKYGDDTNAMLGDLSDKFLHWFPYILFVSLPLFAFILKLLYVRRKQFLYSDHAVFTLYHYIFSFILLLLFFIFNKLHDQTQWNVFDHLMTLLSIIWPVYLFISLKRFYIQGLGKTLGKFLLLNILGMFSLMLIFTLFTFLFIFQL